MLLLYFSLTSFAVYYLVSKSAPGDPYLASPDTIHLGSPGPDHIRVAALTGGLRSGAAAAEAGEEEGGTGGGDT